MDAIADWIYAATNSLSGPGAYLAIFGLLLMSGLGVPLPEDVSLIAGALLAYYGKANVHVMTVVAFAGVMIGDSFVFWMGKNHGHRVLAIPLFRRLLHPERFSRVQQRFHEHGPKILFAARFMPGLRTPTFFSAGMLGIPYWRLLLYDGGAALFSVPAIVYAVWYFGAHVDQVIQSIKDVQTALIVAIVCAALYLIYRAWRKRRAQAKNDSDLPAA